MLSLEAGRPEDSLSVRAPCARGSLLLLGGHCVPRMPSRPRPRSLDPAAQSLCVLTVFCLLVTSVTESVVSKALALRLNLSVSSSQASVLVSCTLAAVTKHINP